MYLRLPAILLCSSVWLPVWAQAEEESEEEHTGDFWSLEVAFAGGGDVIGSTSLIRRVDNQVLASENLTAGDSLRIGGTYMLRRAKGWGVQFAAGFAWGAIGINRSLQPAQSLERIYARAEAIKSLARWRFSGGVVLHTAVKYNSDLTSSFSFQPDPGLRLGGEYALTPNLWLGAVLESIKYRAAGRIWDASSIGVQLSISF